MSQRGQGRAKSFLSFSSKFFKFNRKDLYQEAERDREGSAAAYFGGGEKVGQMEKCIIITNSLHSVYSSKKARLCYTEYYLYLWTFHSKKTSKLYRSGSSLSWNVATSRVEHKGALTAEHWPLPTKEVDVALEVTGWEEASLSILYTH